MAPSVSGPRAPSKGHPVTPVRPCCRGPTSVTPDEKPPTQTTARIELAAGHAFESFSWRDVVVDGADWAMEMEVTPRVVNSSGVLPGRAAGHPHRHGGRRLAAAGREGLPAQRHQRDAGQLPRRGPGRPRAGGGAHPAPWQEECGGPRGGARPRCRRPPRGHGDVDLLGQVARRRPRSSEQAARCRFSPWRGRTDPSSRSSWTRRVPRGRVAPGRPSRSPRGPAPTVRRRRPGRHRDSSS